MATKKNGEKDKELQQGLVVQNIQIRPTVRQTQDIAKWRSALSYAEAINGNRVALYDLYEEVLLDGTLKNIMAKRILGVTKTRMKFIDKSGKEVDQIMQLMEKKAFRDLRKEIMLAKFWGKSVIELMNENGSFRIFSVPRKHIRPETGKIVNEQYGVDGICYRQPPYNRYVLEVGNNKDLGLILEACQYVIYKRGAFGDWANFAQIFGVPFREARYDGYNQEVRQQLENALQQMGSAPYVVLPKEAELTIHEAGNAQGNGELFNTLRKACNDEIAVLILGQTETTTSSASSGYAQSKTHAAVEDAINHDDKEDELAVFNEQVVPILRNLGYAIEGKFIHEPEAEQVSIKDKVEIIDVVRNKLNAPVDDDHIYELTGIPKPKNYDQQKADAETRRKEALKNNKGVNDPEPADPEAEPGKRPASKTKKKVEKLSVEDTVKNVLADFFGTAHKS